MPRAYYSDSITNFLKANYQFDAQGLVIDLFCITWDADFRYTHHGWEHWSFKGKKWQHIKKEERKNYLKNAYRVPLTRARQGMVIVIPPEDKDDPTRPPGFYDETYEYLEGIGIGNLEDC
jgi:hypothetical protein